MRSKGIMGFKDEDDRYMFKGLAIATSTPVTETISTGVYVAAEFGDGIFPAPACERQP